MPSSELTERGREAAATAVALAWLAHAAVPSGAPTATPCEHPTMDAAFAHGASLPSVHCHADGPGRRPLEGPAGLLFGRTLDANRADPLWLEVLPGIGPARAAAWSRERERRPFCRLADLARIPGVGVRTVARVAPWVSVTPTAACAEGKG